MHSSGTSTVTAKCRRVCRTMLEWPHSDFREVTSLSLTVHDVQSRQSAQNMIVLFAYSALVFLAMTWPAMWHRNSNGPKCGDSCAKTRGCERCALTCLGAFSALCAFAGRSGSPGGSLLGMTCSLRAFLRRNRLALRHGEQPSHGVPSFAHTASRQAATRGVSPGRCARPFLSRPGNPGRFISGALRCPP